MYIIQDSKRHVAGAKIPAVELTDLSDLTEPRKAQRTMAALISQQTGLNVWPFLSPSTATFPSEVCMMRSPWLRREQCAGRVRALLSLRRRGSPAAAPVALYTFSPTWTLPPVKVPIQVEQYSLWYYSTLEIGSASHHTLPSTLLRSGIIYRAALRSSSGGVS